MGTFLHTVQYTSEKHQVSSITKRDYCLIIYKKMYACVCMYVHVCDRKLFTNFKVYEYVHQINSRIWKDAGR